MNVWKFGIFATYAVFCLMAASCRQSTASFNFKMDDKLISGQGVDERKYRNVAFSYPVKGNDDALLIMLYSSKDGADPKPGYSLRIALPARPGTYSRRGNVVFDQRVLRAFYLDFLTGDRRRYSVKQDTAGKDFATVTIIDNDGNRVTGTFSAVLSFEDDPQTGTAKQVTISDGKFDVPLSNNKMFRSGIAIPFL